VVLAVLAHDEEVAHRTRTSECARSPARSVGAAREAAHQRGCVPRARTRR
jgi:hypothetical protein